MPVGCLILPRFTAEAQALRSPHLRGRPIAVHHRGYLLACSPPCLACPERTRREHSERLGGEDHTGLAAGMPLGQARAICPQAEFIAYLEDHYRPYHRQVLDICATYSSAVEPVGLDEIFLHLDSIGSPAQALTEVADAIGAGGFTCRTGAASSKLVARVAALARPGTAVVAGNEGAFLAPLPLSRLWMLDADTLEHLQALGIHTIGLLQETPLAQLTLRFGRMARRLIELAFGRDATPVRPLYPPQTIEASISLLDGVGASSCEAPTQSGRSREGEAIEACLRQLASRIARQLAARRQACRCLSMEIETDDGHVLSRSLRLATPACVEDDLLRAARRLLARIAVAEPAAGLTLRAGDLCRCESVQRDLFGITNLAERKRARLAGALASAQEQFGSRTILRAGDLEVPRRERMLTFYP